MAAFKASSTATFGGSDVSLEQIDGLSLGAGRHQSLYVACKLLQNVRQTSRVILLEAHNAPSHCKMFNLPNTSNALSTAPGIAKSN